MQRMLLAAALAAVSTVAISQEAAAWQRSTTVNTWRGTYSAQGSGGCAYGNCQRSYSATGPYGGTVSRQGNVTRTPYGYDYSRTTTGPHGRSVTRSGHVHRY